MTDQMGWRHLLGSLDDSLVLLPPVAPANLVAVEDQLGVPFPPELRDVYAATNGLLSDRPDRLPDRPESWRVLARLDLGGIST